MKTVMIPWRPGLLEVDDLPMEHKQLLADFESNGGVVTSVDENEDTVEIQLGSGQRFWVSTMYIEKVTKH